MTSLTERLSTLMDWVSTSQFRWTENSPFPTDDVETTARYDDGDHLLALPKALNVMH